MRYIFIDSIDNISENLIEGSKYLCLNEDIFRDHFPNRPIMPAALMIEAGIQLGRLYVWNISQFKYTLLPSAFESFKFLGIITPGSILKISLTMEQGQNVEYQLNHIVKMKAVGYSNEKKVFQGKIEFQIVLLEKLHDQKKCRDYMNFLMTNYKGR